VASFTPWQIHLRKKEFSVRTGETGGRTAEPVWRFLFFDVSFLLDDDDE
jgi:hypothetical protein